MTSTDPSNPDRLYTAEEIANYVVCPESWRLKYLVQPYRTPANSPTEAATRRKAWTRQQELSWQLSSYAKVAYLLLVALAILVFIIDHQRTGFSFGSSELRPAAVDRPQTPEELPSHRDGPKSVPPELFQLLLVLGLLIFMWDFFERRSKNLKRASGLSERSHVLSAKGSNVLAAETLQSEKLGLTSKPDAIVQDGSDVIPVAIHPLTNKVRDRHVVALLVHLQLVEEREGKRPPHGILVMGTKQRRVQIANTEEKQRWLDSLVDEMRSIEFEQVPAVPAPSLQKCKHCDVRKNCRYSAYLPTVKLPLTE